MYFHPRYLFQGAVCISQQHCSLVFHFYREFNGTTIGWQLLCYFVFWLLSSHTFPTNDKKSPRKFKSISCISLIFYLLFQWYSFHRKIIRVISLQSTWITFSFNDLLFSHLYLLTIFFLTANNYWILFFIFTFFLFTLK